MKICESCQEEHGGTYGSGRFCSAKCAKSFSTKNKNDSGKKKKSNCIECGTEI